MNAALNGPTKGMSMRIKMFVAVALLMVAGAGMVSAEEHSNLTPSRQEVASFADLLAAQAPNDAASAEAYAIDDLLGTQVLCGGPGAYCRSNAACCDGFCAKVSTYGWCM